MVTTRNIGLLGFGFFFFLLLFIFCFIGSGVWTQGFMLAKQVLYTSSWFCSGYFGLSWTICLGWSWTSILPISAFQVVHGILELLTGLVLEES
jgi:hypothetical protein